MVFENFHASLVGDTSAEETRPSPALVRTFFCDWWCNEQSMVSLSFLLKLDAEDAMNATGLAGKRMCRTFRRVSRLINIHQWSSQA